jgi:phage repressor protein C with HTH and peptisase S24 domain
MAMDSKEIGAVIRAARERRDLSQAKLGAMIGVKQASIQAVETGDTARSKFLPEIARALQIPPADVGLPSSDPPAEAKVAQEAMPGPDLAPSDIGARDVPVLGTAMGGTSADERGVDFWLSGEVENHVARPKGLARASNVFCLYIGGDSMEPRFEERDMVFVQKTMPGIGDDCVIELHPPIDGGDHPTFIKRMVRRNQTFITVKQYNPPKELEFSFKEIKNLFRVIPVKELLG